MIVETNRLPQTDWTDEQIAAFRQRMSIVLDYEPRIGFLGKTGVGKSSLCNALFGKPVCAVSHVEAATREPQEVLLSLPSAGLKLIDLPGIGEDASRDAEYLALYRHMAPALDAVLWVLRADERAYATDLAALTDIVAPLAAAGVPLILVLTHADAVAPQRHWDDANRQPGTAQQATLEAKVAAVAAQFGLPPERIVPVSATEAWNLHGVIDALLHALPREKRVALMRETPVEHTCDACQDMVRTTFEEIWQEAYLEVIQGYGRPGEGRWESSKRILETLACTALDRATKFIERMTERL
jgi:predicted GTPase